MLFSEHPNRKKGTVEDLFFIMIVSVIFITTVIVAMIVWDGIRDSELFDSPATANIKASGDALQDLWDVLFTMFFLMGSMGALISAFLSGAHPIFLWASVLLSILLIIVGAVMNNYFDAFINEEELAEVKAKLPMTVFIFDNFTIFLVGYLMLLMIVLYFPTRLREG